MIKKIWTWKRVLSIIFLPMIILLFGVAAMRALLFGGDIGVVLFLSGTTLFCTYLFVECAFPKRFDCMKIVKKYLSFKELKCCIQKEQFHKYEFQDPSDSFQFYYSQNWIFVQDVYIPRKMILDIVSIKEQWYSSYTMIGIITKNGCFVLIAKVKCGIEEKAMDSLRKQFPEFENSIEVLKNAHKKAFYKTLGETFQKEVTNKKDFIAYCKI